MPADYNKIRDDNIREYGEGIRHLAFLGRLYTDRTHFIFELLQNAEDAGAKRIYFSLFDDRLEVSHDGRPFDEKDVRGVCGVAEGTKNEDLTKIGKFGIGFKSVYAYTATPEIHSGSEDFKIDSYVRPQGLLHQQHDNGWTTYLVLPFDADKVSMETACNEISNRLKNLSSRTLLFLRSITEIEYKLPCSTFGKYLREEFNRGSARQVNITDENNGKIEEKNWLIFERLVPIPGKSETVRVEVSFQLGTKDKTGKNSEHIVKVRDSPLVVYFPTEKETRFGFLIQGPYRTTPSRDNIPRDDEWNKTLINETAELIKDVLLEIKNLGLLSAAFLESLPIRIEDFPEDGMFYPIFESVQNTLINEPLLPADDGSFVSAENAILASANWLRKLIRRDELTLLYGRELRWVSNEITERGRPELWNYLREDLNIEELTPDAFARKIDISFLNNQSDDWMIRFYQQLPNQKTLWKKGIGTFWDKDGPLRKKPFIRLQDGSHVKPFRTDNEPNAYMTDKRIDDPLLQTVKYEISEDQEARHFLKTHLQIPEFDIVSEVIKYVLPKYNSPNPPQEADHERDIERILQAYETDSLQSRSKLMKALQETPFILSRTLVSGDELYRRPGVLYFHNESLDIYFSQNVDVCFVSSIYQNLALDLFDKLGVTSEVRVTCRPYVGSKDFINLEHESEYRRGLSGFDPDTIVDGLSDALKEPSVEKSQIIWNKICIPYSRCIRGKVLRSSRRDFSPDAGIHEEEEMVSESFGQLLIDYAWMPAKENQFLKPSEVSLDELPNQFERDENLAYLLGMKNDVVDRLAEEAGISSDDINLVKEHAEEFKQWKAEIAAREEQNFPTRPVKDPERRQERLGEQLTEAPDKEYKKRETSVRATKGTIDPITWLRNQYTNETGQMVCQICKDEMPFRKRDDTHYFETKEVLSEKHLPKENEPQYLALCPICAAKYKEFIKYDDGVMTKLKHAIVSEKSCEVPIDFGNEKTSIRFVESHLLDLKTIINSLERSDPDQS